MAINPSHEDIAKDSANGAQENQNRKWVWWLLPVVLFLSITSAFWGIRHIEKQVLAAAPSILRDAGVDTADLRFQAEYRDITVSGQLPPGVKSTVVRELLEQNRGAAGEDIRRATIVAVERVKFAPSNDSTEVSGALSDEALRPGAIGPNKRNDTTHDALADTATDSPEPDNAQEPLQNVTSPRVNILLAEGALTMSGRDVSRPQVNRILDAASASVGLPNVKQQWQVARLSDTPLLSDERPRDIQQVEPLASLVALLGDHATAASITLEDNLISGSIEASSEHSVSLLRARGGDGVVVTSVVNSERVTSSSAGSGKQVTPSNMTDDNDDKPVDTAEVVDVESNSGTSNEANSRRVNSERGDEESAVVDDGNTLAAIDNGDGNKNDNRSDEDKVLRQEISALQIEIDALQLLLRDNVFFVHDSSAITREALPILDKVGAAMRRYRLPSVQISGHTDSVSSRGYNLRLSKHRAAAVMQFLTQNGVDAKRLRSEGYGEDRPVASNRTKPGRRLNRRVEFTARKPFDHGEQ